MSGSLAERLCAKYFGGETHPYRAFEHAVERHLSPDATLLDAGCGYGAPILKRFQGKAARYIGVDFVDFDEQIAGIELYQGDLGCIPIPDACVDVVMCRSVMEHVAAPRDVYREMFRIIKPGGYFIFLTANLWDYASIAARLIPNRLHPWIVSRTEGREERDVFPTEYKTNTRRAVYRYATGAGFEVLSCEYLGQHPNYFLFNGVLFFIATGYEKFISRFKSLHFLRGWILAVLQKPLDATHSRSDLG